MLKSALMAGHQLASTGVFVGLYYAKKSDGNGENEDWENEEHDNKDNFVLKQT